MFDDSCGPTGPAGRDGLVISGLWRAATASTGTVCGFYLSQALVLGRYFTWLTDPAATERSVASYAAFRRAHSTAPYYLVLVGQGATTIAFAAMSWRRPWRRRALLAAAGPVAIGATHALSGFGAAEVEVLSGRGTAEQTRTFRTWNVTLHAAYAVVMALGLGALLGCRPARGNA